jgi:hypothetical protein
MLHLRVSKSCIIRISPPPHTLSKLSACSRASLCMQSYRYSPLDPSINFIRTSPHSLTQKSADIFFALSCSPSVGLPCLKSHSFVTTQKTMKVSTCKSGTLYVFHIRLFSASILKETKIVFRTIQG